jgi:hypothetical protein
VLRRGLALWLVLFGAYCATLGLGAGERYAPREAHALLSAESIVSDGDVDLRDEYATRAWRAFTDRPLRPTAGLVEGRLVEPQGVGFPLLIAPAYAIGGATAVELWLAAIAALGFVLAAGLARRLAPEPWASGAALVVGLSPPMLAAATAVSPEAAGGTALAAAALGALAVRDRPRAGVAIASAAAIAMTPWLAVQLAAAGAVCAVALARWLRRRARGWTALVSLELVFTSLVVYATLERAPRLVGLWLDRDAGLLRWAPFVGLAGWALWLLWRSRRYRLAAARPERVDAEVAAAFLAAIAGVQLLVAAFVAPALHGAWGPARLLVPALPALAALAAWGWRFAVRVGSVLAALTLAGSVWVLVGPRLGDGGLAPLRGDVPWGGIEDVLPRFGGALGAGEAVLIALVVVPLAGLVAREAPAPRI